jgi:isocitrate/isopropylmalate dehydrogenase
MVLSLAMGNHLTRDLGGTCSTTEFTDELVKEIKSRS